MSIDARTNARDDQCVCASYAVDKTFCLEESQYRADESNAFNEGACESASESRQEILYTMAIDARTNARDDRCVCASYAVDKTFCLEESLSGADESNVK